MVHRVLYEQAVGVLMQLAVVHAESTEYRQCLRTSASALLDYGQIPLDGPDRTLSETQVYDKVSDKVRSDPLGSPTSPRTLSGRRHVCSISTCTDFVRGSGRVADKVRGSV